MRNIPFGENVAARITVMRQEDPSGISDELQDGNMLPRLCEFAGAGACEKACQLKLMPDDTIAEFNSCAEGNILSALAEVGVVPENFAMVAATKDRVGFADSLKELGASTHEDGYTMVPACNAFFFRPGKDRTAGSYRNLTHVAMRMADCGDVVYSLKDREGQDVIGIAHFSRTNMRGPSEYMHEVDGKKVSWGEYVLAQAVAHYGADLSTVQIRLVAAVEGRNFIHSYKNLEAMWNHFPGWDELGFMHPTGFTEFDCLIDYREMIAWQLTQSIQDPALKLHPRQVDTSAVIDTGNLRLGHASHHAATKGIIPHGRDMYILGLNEQKYILTRQKELRQLHAVRSWGAGNIDKILGGEATPEDLEYFSRLYAAGLKEFKDLSARLAALNR